MFATSLQSTTVADTVTKFTVLDEEANADFLTEFGSGSVTRDGLFMLHGDKLISGIRLLR